MSIKRVALIFDDTTRPETTGVYCRNALKRLLQVEHFHPNHMDRIPREGFDLFLNIDDGMRYHLPAELRPAATWVIDTHMDFGWSLEKTRSYDFVFAAQRDGAAQLRQSGIETATWLPLACDPQVHKADRYPKRYDVCFVGNLFPGPRAELVEAIQAEFDKTFVGRAYFEEMAKVYSQSRIAFNRSIRNDVNMRVFEALSCATLLVTNDLAENGQEELFHDGQHLVTYRDPDECLEKIRYYLEHEVERRRLAAAGRGEAHQKHTYRHRMQTLLEHAESGHTTQVRGATAPISEERELTPIEPADGSSSLPASSESSCTTSSHDPSYFDFARPELLERIPAEAKHVLDVGCGAGRLGEALKQRQDCHVTGLELDPSAAQAAATRLDRVVRSDLEAGTLELEPHSLDAIVCGDVLEHLVHPLRALQTLREFLRPGGVVIASVPNVRNHSVIRSLIKGNWTYEPAGLLDETHLRFFTRRSLEDLFALAGFRIKTLAAVQDGAAQQWEAAGRPQTIQLGGWQLNGIPPEEAQEFFTYQFLVTAVPAVPKTSPAPMTQWSEETARPTEPTTDLPHFTQDFVRDLEQIRLDGRPFALARFADGERAVCMGKAITGIDGWNFDGSTQSLIEDLNAALRYDAPGYYLGLSDGCCDRTARDWYLERVRVPQERITFSNIFVNWNYRRFRQWDLSKTAIIAPVNGDFTVPADMFATPDFDWDELADQLTHVDRPILVSAGPASGILIHKYWERVSDDARQTILDVGSALDEWTKGTRSRSYQVPGTQNAELVCAW